MYIENHFVHPNTFFTADISGMAGFFLEKETSLATFNSDGCKVPASVKELIDKTTGDVIGVDLIIDSVQWPYGDVFKLEPCIGNTFHMHFLGMGPITATISGAIIDLQETYSKKNLMLLYEHLFRPTAIVRHKVVPTLQCMGYFMTGSILSIELSEQAYIQDVINFVMQFQVLKLHIVTPDTPTTYKDIKIEFA